MLTEHRVNDADEGLIAVEQPVPSRQQVAFQPALALMLAEHRVQHLSGRGKEFVVWNLACIPLTVGDLKDRPQQIGQRLIRSEYPEISFRLIQLGHVTQELAQHHRILCGHGARRRHGYRVLMKIGHPQIMQQKPAVGMRIGAHAPVALGGQISQFRQQAAIVIEQLLGLVAFHPGFKLRDMFGMVGVDEQRHLMRAKRALDLEGHRQLSVPSSPWATEGLSSANAAARCRSETGHSVESAGCR